MLFSITSIYAAALAVGVIILANIVSAHRSRTGISIFHGDDMRLGLAIRRHGNLAENAALALLLLALCEARGLSPLWLHAMGLTLLLARLANVVGLDATRPTAPLRIAGGAGTQLMMLAAAGYLVWSQF